MGEFAADYRRRFGEFRSWTFTLAAKTALMT
jgi:hypothetical protein